VDDAVTGILKTGDLKEGADFSNRRGGAQGQRRLPKLELSGVNRQWAQCFCQPRALVNELVLRVIHERSCQRREEAFSKSDSHGDLRCPTQIQKIREDREQGDCNVVFEIPDFPERYAPSPSKLYHLSKKTVVAPIESPVIDAMRKRQFRMVLDDHLRPAPGYKPNLNGGICVAQDGKQRCCNDNVSNVRPVKEQDSLWSLSVPAGVFPMIAENGPVHEGNQRLQR
jgi:hypothetical protein